MHENTVIPKRCPVCASDNIEGEGLASDDMEHRPKDHDNDSNIETEAFELWSCNGCKSRWICRARLHWYESEVTHEALGSLPELTFGGDSN